MWIRRHHREVPSLNTSSTADISFMLLVFFLMTSSMNSDKGLSRQLPPADKTQTATTDVNKSDVMQIRLDDSDVVWVDDRMTTLAELQKEVESFLSSRQSSRYVVGITTDRRASYNAYFDMQNTIVVAFRQVRERMAQHRYGVHFAQCNPAQRDAIIGRYPLRISEAVTSQMATTATKGGRDE